MPSSIHASRHDDPSFGWDPWLGPGKPPTDAQVARAVVDLPFPFSGADTLAGDIQLLPAGLAFYGSYIDNFKGWDELVRRFGKSRAFLLSITIFGGKARCADVEPGAMHPESVGPWLDHTALRDGGLLPWVYTSAGNFKTVNAQIGARKVVRWSAHYGFGPHVCGPSTCGFPQADWTQWTDTGPNGENYDRSVGLMIPTPPPPPDPNHYAWYDDKKRAVYGFNTERATVEEYDRLRAGETPTQHPNRVRLAVLKLRCRAGAGRIWTLASKKPGRKASWDLAHRGWRWQLLTHRAQGKRVA